MYLSHKLPKRLQSLLWTGVLVIVSLLAGAAVEGLLAKIDRSGRDPAWIGSLSPYLVEMDGFSIREQHHWNSDSDNSRLVFDLQGHNVDQIRVRIAGRVNTPIKLRIFSFNGSQERLLERPWQARLNYTPYLFMTGAVFDVRDRVGKLVIESSGSGITILEVIAEKHHRYNLIRGLFAAGMIFLLLMCKYLGSFKSRGVELMFLAVALVCGFFMVAFSPKNFVSWDEAIHYKNADKNSLHMLVEQKVHDVYSRAHVLTSSFSFREQKEIDDFFNARTVDRNGLEMPSKNLSWSEYVFGWYRDVGYLPSAMGLFAGRAIGLENSKVFLTGRLANLLAYVLLAYFAIKIAPIGRLMMASIALMPTSIFLASHYSYDPWLTAWCMLGLAQFLKLYFRRSQPASGWELAFLVFSFFIGVGPKAIYCLVVLLPLLIPKSAIGSSRSVWIFRTSVVAMFLFSLASFLLPFVVDGPGRGDSRGGAGVNSAEQVAYVIGNPATYAVDLIRFLLGYLNPVNFSTLSVEFAYLGVVDGFFVILLVLVSCLVMDFICSKSLEFGGGAFMRYRFAAVFIFFSTVALIASALYVAYTPVGSHSIAGVQSRYLTPLLPFILLAFIPVEHGGFPRLSTLTWGRTSLMVIGLVTMYGIWTNIASHYY